MKRNTGINSRINKVISVLNKVSTKPNALSYKWHGSISVISWFILNVIYVERIFSVLQWGKYAYRRVVKWSRGNMASTDERSQRVNVPSVFVEIYYLLAAALMVVVAQSDCSGSLWAHCLAIYLLADSFVWLLYYFFFRRFFEENYAIMHALEYPVLLPLVIACQVACISIIWNVKIQKTFALLMAPDASSPTIIILLGVLYTAVILGLIISNLPTENVKVRSDHKYHISIIGNGDVVRNRLLPAFYSVSKELKKYMSVSISDKCDARKALDKRRKIDKGYVSLTYLNCDSPAHLKEIINSEIIWIATPSYSHYTYIEKYKNKAKLLVVEKPIVIFKRELDIMQRLISGNDGKIFCLSYYYLEKALPFVYLQNPLAFYEKYLKMSAARESIFSSFSKLGALRGISLHLCEGHDNRAWLQDEKFGGQYFETFIHLVVLAFAALDNDDTLVADKWSVKDNNNVPGSYILCQGHSGKGISVLLEMGKYMERKRSGVLQYENGAIFLDFDNRAISCKFFDKAFSCHDFEIATIDKPNYFIQLDMVERCFADGLQPNDIDGYEVQVKALEWMFQQKRE